MNFPNVSILIAARNEANNILACLQAINLLDYPNFEVWVGNDQSEDETAQLVRDFISGKPHFNLLEIEGNLGKARGKANVLAQLVHKAKGNLFLITDADVIVPSTWAKAMVEAYKPKYGLITGCTIPEGDGIFAKMQALDWVQALSLLKFSSDWGLPLTAMGNNLLVSREAYFSIGGYEKIPFSITEDYELFKQLKIKGWQSSQLFEKSILAKTKPAPSFLQLLQQRKRWMHGAMQVPWFIKVALASQVLFYPFILALLFLLPIWGISIWMGKILLQSVWAFYQLKKIGETNLAWWLPLHEFYNGFLLLSMTIFYFMPIPVIWKGRKYD